MSKRIPLDGLYELIDVLMNNPDYRYCAVQFRIKDNELANAMGGNVLFQIWEKGGRKMFERVYNNPVKSWALCSEHIVYIPPDGDKDSDCFYFVKPQNGCSIMVIKNWLARQKFDHYIYGGAREKMFVLNNDKEIQIVKLDDDTPYGETSARKQIDMLSVCRYRPGDNFHKIRMVYTTKNFQLAGSFMVMVELQDGQLDIS